MSYGTLKSKPIPIQVKALATTPHAQTPPQKGVAVPEKPFSKTPGPIEIYWWVLVLIPLALTALLVQLALRKYVENNKTSEPKKTSDLYFSEALKADPHSPVFYQLINKALILRLVEKGKLKDPKTPVDQLSAEGIAGEVKAHLMRLEEMRFAGPKTVIDDKWIAEAKALFRKI
jgi:hypothetical protein